MRFVTSLAQQACLQFFVASSAWNIRGSWKIPAQMFQGGGLGSGETFALYTAGQELRTIWRWAQSQTLPEWREWVWRVRKCGLAMPGKPPSCLSWRGLGSPPASPEPEGALRALGCLSMGAQPAHPQDLVRSAESRGPPQPLNPRLWGRGPEDCGPASPASHDAPRSSLNVWPRAEPHESPEDLIKGRFGICGSAVGPWSLRV